MPNVTKKAKIRYVGKITKIKQIKKIKNKNKNK